MDPRRLWNFGIAIGIVVCLLGLASLFMGLENERSANELGTAYEGTAYSVGIHASSGRPVQVNYSLSNGTMTVMIISLEGHDELVSTGQPLESQTYYRAEDKSYGVIDWTPPTTGIYFVVFYEFSGDGATLRATVDYAGSIPDLMIIGAAAAIIGLVIVVVSALLRQRGLAPPLPPAEGNPPQLKS